MPVFEKRRALLLSMGGASLAGLASKAFGAPVVQQIGDLAVSVKGFGAAGDGQTDDTQAFAEAISYCTASANRPSLYVPAGKYIVDSLLLDSVRGLKIVGDTGGDELASTAKTWIYWKSGSKQPFLLSLRSCAYMTFENISFFSNHNKNKNCMVVFECNGESTSLPRNKFASTRVDFRNCAFVVPPAAPCEIATVFQKSTLQVGYTNCTFSGARAIKLGLDQDFDPVSREKTIPDGRAVQTTFTSCIFRGDVVRERIIGVSFYQSYFGKNSVPYDGNNFEVCGMTLSGLQEIRNELLVSNVCDVFGVNTNRAVWYEGPDPAGGIEPTLTAINNFLNGASILFDIRRGSANLSGNTFLAQKMQGSAEWSAIRLHKGVQRVAIEANDYSRLLGMNGRSVQARAITDLRDGPQGKLDHVLESDIALKGNGFVKVAAVPIRNPAGVLAEVSYQVSISSAVDAAFAAQVVIDGVVVPGTRIRFTTSTAAPKSFQLSLAPRQFRLEPVPGSAARTIELQVKQESGQPYATVLGASSNLSDTWLSVREISG